MLAALAIGQVLSVEIVAAQMSPGRREVKREPGTRRPRHRPTALNGPGGGLGAARGAFRCAAPASAAASRGRRLADKLEPEASGIGQRLDKAHLDRIAEAERLAGRAADQAMMRLVIFVEILADRRDRHEAVGAALASSTKSPARVTPRMRPSKWAPTRSASQKAISRSTVSRSAAMARRSATEISPATRSRVFSSAARKPPGAEPERGDQRAMHEEVGVAADRRGEVDVAAKVQPEMADIRRWNIPPGFASAGSPR